MKLPAMACAMTLFIVLFVSFFAYSYFNPPRSTVTYACALEP